MYRALNILGLYARVIFYPLGKDAPWGFTRISGSQNDSNVEKPFVAVNAFESYLVTYEKLEDLLELCGLKPDDLGISPPLFSKCFCRLAICPGQATAIAIPMAARHRMITGRGPLLFSSNSFKRTETISDPPRKIVIDAARGSSGRNCFIALMTVQCVRYK